MDKAEIEGTSQEKRLYDLIWKRTAASQMADAQIEKTTVNINISGCDEKFVANGEIIAFDGFI
jgi:DNA topoisomerase-1